MEASPLAAADAALSEGDLKDPESSKVELEGGVVTPDSRVHWTEEALEWEETLWLGEEFAPPSARDDARLPRDLGLPGGTKEGGRSPVVEEWLEFLGRRLPMGW